MKANIERSKRGPHPSRAGRCEVTNRPPELVWTLESICGLEVHGGPVNVRRRPFDIQN